MNNGSDQGLQPEGELSLQLPAENDATNMFGDVYGGWVSAKMVQASEIFSARLSKGRVSTVSIGQMVFMSPVHTGTIMSFYTKLLEAGQTSMRIQVEAWGCAPDGTEFRKVTDTECVQVAIDGHGHIREISAY
ncbi:MULTISPECIES: hotdog domain-containing protein [unclassified Neptuniibacter]|uniref:acyl-CoA thioesterase n=1 Tax=unclassified Neptuniibacter TaxID=2630693 RepID=UPI000C67D168|nr:MULTISPECIES: hotdog domain-containing protein [unclassified Neptuniibacter]MAY41501.1 acyl-CoA thioesterase [Oceanospirillaceae bacterium]|tara:strand:+ start:7033 stop:7431 length:399 start_codon:yes stop_codon:yes gene_type:complete